MDLQAALSRKEDLFLKPPAILKLVMIAFLIIGAISLGYGFGNETLQTRTWGALLLANFFLFSVALGGVAFGLMQDVLAAHWGRPIKRIHEAFGSYLIIATAIFIVMFVFISLRKLGAGELYSWIADPDSIHHFWGKNVWLSESFMMIRDVAALAIILILALWQYKQTLTRDVMLLKNGESTEFKKESQLSQGKLKYFAAPILVVYGVLYSLLAFDLTMSLAPKWFSTLWGGWSFAVLMQTLMANTLVIMFALRSTPLGKFYGRSQFHDVGKLMHAFTIFFAYLTYAHVLTYWYANMPETAEFYIHRLHQPWKTLVIVAPLLNFVLPLFALIPKMSKWTFGITVPIALVILFSQILTYIIVVTPSITDGANWHSPLLEYGVALGLYGLFLACFFFFGKKFPMISVGDPILPEAYAKHH